MYVMGLVLWELVFRCIVVDGKGKNILKKDIYVYYIYMKRDDYI